MKKLYPPQEVEMQKAVESLRTHKAYLESAKTGCGKTLIALEAAKTLGLDAVVLAPQAVLPAWRKAAAEQGVSIEAINYEMVRTGRTKYGFFTEANENGPGKFHWSVRNKLMVLDEVHRCMGSVTRAAKMLMGCRDAGLPVLMLSATPCENPAEMKAIGYVLRLHNEVNFVTWATARGCEFDLFGKLCFPHDAETSLGAAHLTALRKEIYGAGKGGQLTREDMKGHFQECTLITDPVDFGDKGAIAKLYAEMEEELEVVQDSIELDQKKVLARAKMKGLEPEEAVENALTRMLRARQTAELLKVPLILARIKDLRSEKTSVAVFVNFNATIDAIRERLDEPYSQVRGQIDGRQQTPAERNVEIENFQRNAHRIILCNNEAGGTGVNLHDEHGGHPRVSLISPSFNAKTTEQVLGRIDRAGSQTPSVQIILAAQGTIEERVVQSVTCKLRNLSALHQVEPVAPSPTIMQPAEEPVLEFTEDNPCGTVVTVPVTEQVAVPAVKKAAKKKVVVVAPAVEKPSPAVVTEDPPAHAKYGPSSLKMYEVAPMYQPTKGSGPAAEMGTRIHLACETGNLDVLVDEERLIAEKLLNGVDMIVRRHKLDLSQCEDHKEIRLTMVTEATIWQDEYDSVTGEKIGGGWKVIETFGTCDRLFISGSVGVMIDYKTGRNSVEDPEINAQTQAYVAGAFQKFPQLQTITFYFLLPVRDEVSFATYTRGQLPMLLLRIATIIKRAMTATTCNPQPGICDFCALADGRCQQLNQFALPIAAKYQLEGYPIPENVHASENSDPVNLARLLQLARIMEKWSGSVKYRCQQAVVEDGLELPGFNLIRTKGRSSVLSTTGAWNVLQDVLSIEDFLACSDLSLSKLEDFVSAKAARGEKGAAAAAIKGKLIDADVIAESEGSYQLRVKKA